MGFLGDLANAINSSFDVAQNTTNTLSSVIDGQNIPYGSLGDFQFDQSAERRYVESGYLRQNPYQTDPEAMEVLWQEPSATVLIKKRMFSSISENYRPDFMDQGEKLYYQAMQTLFANKCTQISALEQLSKIQEVTAAVGNISQQLVPTILTLADIINNGYGTGLSGISGLNSLTSSQDVTNFLTVSDRLRVINAYNQTAPYTTWITNPTNLYQSSLANGTGVIEITNFTNLETHCGVHINESYGFSLTISDPYEAMVITDYDIETALSDCTNSYYNNKAYTLGVTSSQQTITDQQGALSQMRSARGAGPITFTVNPNSIFGNEVTAIIQNIGVEIPFIYDPGLLGLGASVTIPPDYLMGGAIAGFNGLSSSDAPIGPDNNIRPLIANDEVSTFQTIIITMFAQIQLMNNAANTSITNNKLINYARRKLRFQFSGKLIIQPMDTVNIYINSKSQTDNKILSGLTQMFSGVGILQNITNTVTAINTLFNPSQNIALQAEKSAYVGPDFPNDIWSMVRTQFVTEIEGTHVFGGVVTAARDSWSNGAFTMSISGEDNKYYFRQGVVNFKPGADAFNGLFFDPLTPFESSFDAVTTNNSPQTYEFLDDNKYLLSDSAAGSMVKFKLGALAGQKATLGNYIQDQGIDPVTKKHTKILYAPDGLAYKWKQGINIFTQTGDTSSINGPNYVGLPNLYKEPFAGLDVMNIISLLVTGTPYNYQLFYQNTANIQGYSGDPLSKQGASQSYIGQLTAALKKQNTLWGNFIPFKSLVLSEAAISQNMQAQQSIANSNSDLDAKIQQFATLQSQLTALGAVNVIATNISGSSNTAVASQFTNLQSQVSNLTASINSALNDVRAQTQQLFAQINNATAYTNNALTDGANDPSDTASRDILRKQINSLTRRMSYNVRANVDKSLFIVDDYYDSDYDIAVFNTALSESEQGVYSYQFLPILDQINLASDKLDLEVFCDTQGHIRARPPQYNKMPSSVFYQMLWLKQTTGLQVFPQFLSKLFTDQLTSLKTQIEVLEDEIRLECAILGYYPSLDIVGDSTAANFISNANITAGQATTFTFISDSTDTITDIPTLLQQANQEAISGTLTQTLQTITANATSTRQMFSNSERYSVLFQALQAQLGASQGLNTNNVPSTNVFAQGSVAQQLITRISVKSGQTISSQDYITSAGPNQPLVIGSNQTIDLFKVTADLQSYIQAWQVAVKNFSLTLQNASEYQALDSDDTTTNSLITPYATSGVGNSSIPQVYAHMIEDETYDDYGPGSGNRYVIHNYQIRHLEVSENPPPYTSIEVQGAFPFTEENFGGAGGGGNGLDSFPGGGNSLVTALAVDYDMWRNYGFKPGEPLKVPFLQDPDTQVGPFAAVVLSRNRANILQARCTISGNEYMQPGEVVYLENRSLLFYVWSVSHNYGEGRDFTTDLELKYGHSIGDYIPSYFDSIGKMICKNTDTTSSTTIVQRQDSSAPEQAVGVIQLSSQNSSAAILYTGSEDSDINPYATTNQTVLNNILYQSSFMINQNGQANNNITAAIELRVYYDSNTPINSALVDAATMVFGALTGANQGPLTVPTNNQPSLPPTLPSNSVTIVEISLDNTADRRSPSQQAIDAARNQVANASNNTGSTYLPTQANNAALRAALYGYVIDCWITYTPVPNAVASGSAATS
jgi:hypothetical protein